MRFPYNNRSHLENVAFSVTHSIARFANFSLLYPDTGRIFYEYSYMSNEIKNEWIFLYSANYNGKVELRNLNIDLTETD